MFYNRQNKIPFADNVPWALRMSENFAIQVLSNATLTVDTYFFLSGFLLAYVYLTDAMSKMQTKPINYAAKMNGFFVAVTKRFIRYVPHYLNSTGR